MQFHDFVYEASYGTLAQLPVSGVPEIAFAGRSNVGKSSLLNKILNRKNLARTSSSPGKTVTVNFFRSGDVRLADLPGYGYAKVPQSEKNRWAALMEGYFSSGRRIALVVQLVDMRHAPSADDYAMLEYLKSVDMPVVIAMTKCDKLKKTQRLKRDGELVEELAEYSDFPRVAVSSVTGEGTEEIKKAILDALNTMNQESE